MNKKDSEKFFFHMNIFDEDHIEEEEEEPPPPPPTFSEEELEAARQSGFAAGKKEGFDEATNKERTSRSALITAVLQRIGEETSTLFAQEQLRAELYEREATALCLSAFEKILPAYQKTFGFEELKTNISIVLQKQQNQREIKIHVHPENVVGIETLMGELTNKGFEVKFSVQGDETLGEGACTMSWHNGGANLNADILAEEIKSLMQQTLAGTDAKGHDSNSEEQSLSETDAVEAQDADKNNNDAPRTDLDDAPEVQSAEDIVEKSDE